MLGFNEVIVESDKDFMVSFKNVEINLKKIGNEKTRPEREKIGNFLYDELTLALHKLVNKKEYNIKLSDIKSVTVQFK